MFDHRNLATGGLFPGITTHRSIANLGHFEIEVTIERWPRGGGGWYDQTDDEDKYRITIRVTSKKGKVWDYSTVVSEETANVVAKLVNIKLHDHPTIVVHSVTVNAQDPQIKVYKK